ncbi:MAG: ATP-dependent Clp protease proteolytic subunit [Spirochaetota bacterium]|nr:ATP-dependent Clp protease proteolytic subunit [Spirochaetota bacterium]
MIYGGPLKSDPSGSTKTQAYRFPKDKFTVEEAKKWLSDHGIEYILFEKATENINLRYFKNQGDGIYELSLKGIVGEVLNGDLVAHEIDYLNTIDAKVIRERINSVGGEIINGFSIVESNLNSKAEIHTINGGMAGSIMSLILATGTPGKRLGYDYSTAVVHDPSFDGETLENIEDEKVKEETQKFKDSLVQLYANNTKMTKSFVSKMMTEDKLLNAKEQLEYGLIDEILPSKMKPVITKNMSYEEIMNVCSDKSKFQNVFNPNSSRIAESEPSWATIDKRELPKEAFADGRSENASEWSYPHHFVTDGNVNEETERYETGTMYLHKGGLNAAWAAAQGARTGEKANEYIINHLNKHRKDLGLTDKNTTKMSNLTKFYNLSDEADETSILKEAQKDRSELKLYENKVKALETSGAEKDAEITKLKTEVEKFRNEAITEMVKADIKAGKFLAENEESLIENAKTIGIDAYKSFSANVAPKAVNVLNQIQTGVQTGEKKSKEQILGEKWQDLITNDKIEAQRIRNEEPAKYEEYVLAWNNLK